MVMRRRLALVAAIGFSGLALLACSLTGAATDAPTPPPPTPPPASASSTPLPTAAPSTATATSAPSATRVPPTPTLTPTRSIILAVAATDKTVRLVTLEGTTLPLAQAPGTLYALAMLSSAPGAPSHAYAIGPKGVKQLPFVNNSSEGFASYIDPAAAQGQVAWDHWASNAATSTVDSEIFVANVDGSNLRSVLKLSSDHVLHVVRFSPDGQRLYYSQEPLGLGGYIPFGGVSDLWALDLASGATAQLVPAAAAGAICLDDFASDESEVALHCSEKFIDLLVPSTGGIGLIEPPPAVTGWRLLGDARISPDQSRVAYALARGNPDNEQGWLAVSDGLTGTSHLLATAPAGDYFSVKGWLDDHTLVLQSWGAKPGVWVVRVDTGELRRIADGIFLGGG